MTSVVDAGRNIVTLANHYTNWLGQTLRRIGLCPENDFAVFR